MLDKKLKSEACGDVGQGKLSDIGRAPLRRNGMAESFRGHRAIRSEVLLYRHQI